MGAINFDHLERLTDETGIFQHATYTRPNPVHGYCTDDNARALIVAIKACAIGTARDRLPALADVYLGFITGAFDASTQTFHNFMKSNGQWLEETPSPDSQGRAVWSLGVAASEAPGAEQRRRARDLFLRALPAVEHLHDLRAMASVILGLAVADPVEPPGGLAAETLSKLGSRLYGCFATRGAPDWPWPEDLLTYDNARLTQALIVSGIAMGRDEIVATGLRALDWLLSIQTVDGHFAPIGNDGWYRRGGRPARFDQQPLEADATIAACVAAWRKTGDRRWLDRAGLCFRWYLGENDLGLPLHDAESGGCRDGLHSDRLNENQGAESTLAWLSSAIQMEQLAQEGVLPLMSLPNGENFG